MLATATDPDGDRNDVAALMPAHSCGCDPAVAQARQAYTAALLSMMPDRTAEANTGLHGQYVQVFHGGITPVPLRAQRELLEVPAASAAVTFEGDI